MSFSFDGRLKVAREASAKAEASSVAPTCSRRAEGETGTFCFFLSGEGESAVSSLFFLFCSPICTIMLFYGSMAGGRIQDR
jgi:hypothetical protein